MKKVRTTEWGGYWEQYTMMASQAGVVRDIHWDINLVHNLELR